jgi:thioredoxin reductase (NADPH)
LTELGIATIDGPCRAIRCEGDEIVLETAKRSLTFDSVYPALGSDVRNELASQLGAGMTEGGCIVVDAHQRTSVPGLYAAGDVVIGLDQISHAMGEGGVAATTIRNDLAKERPLLR